MNFDFSKAIFYRNRARAPRISLGIMTDFFFAASNEAHSYNNFGEFIERRVSKEIYFLEHCAAPARPAALDEIYTENAPFIF